jgi:hypothetical protein
MQEEILARRKGAKEDKQSLIISELPYFSDFAGLAAL